MTRSFVPPQFDLMFKQVFGNKLKLNPLRSFLSSILNIPAQDLATLHIVDTHLHPPHADGKLGIVDVRVTTVTGREIDVEIQRLHENNFGDRLVFYGSRMLGAQLDEGQAYDELNQVITVAITGFILIPEAPHKFHHRFRMLDEDNLAQLSNVLQVNTLELPKLPSEDDGTLLWKWLRFIAVRTREELDMVAKFDPVIADAAETVRDYNKRREMYLAWLSYDRAERDRISHEKAVANRDKALADRDKALADRDKALADRDKALADRDRAVTDHEKAVTDRDKAVTDHEKAVTDRDKAVTDHEKAVTDRDRAVTDHEKAVTDRDKAVTDRDKAVTDHEKAVTDHEKDVADHEKAVADHEKAVADHEKENIRKEKALVAHERELEERSKAFEEHVRSRETEGARQARHDVARRALENGFDPETVASLTGLSVEDVRSLA